MLYKANWLNYVRLVSASKWSWAIAWFLRPRQTRSCFNGWVFTSVTTVVNLSAFTKMKSNAGCICTCYQCKTPATAFPRHLRQIMALRSHVMIHHAALRKQNQCSICKNGVLRKVPICAFLDIGYQCSKAASLWMRHLQIIMSPGNWKKKWLLNERQKAEWTFHTYTDFSIGCISPFKDVIMTSPKGE